MIEFTMFHSGKAGQSYNTYYPNKITIKSAKDLQKACQFDHVCIEFTNNHRCNPDFVKAYAIAADCDNDDTENRAEWLDPVKVSERLPGVGFYYCKSRNCDKVKHPGEANEHSARPRYHYYFPLLHPVPDVNITRNIMARLLEVFPEFDKGGTKPAQFFYGHATPETGEIAGDTDIGRYLAEHPEIKAPTPPQVPESEQPEKPPERIKPQKDFCTDYVKQNMADWLAAIPAIDYETWYKVGMAIKAAGEDISLWDDWSQTAKDFYSGYRDLVYKWNSFKRSGITAKTICYFAKQHGWQQDMNKLTGEAKANHEAAEEARKAHEKYQQEHRAQHIAALAAVGIETDNPYRYTWTLDFDGSIEEVIDTATGDIVYTKSENDIQTAREQGLTLRPANPAAAAPVNAAPDPEAPWEPLDKGQALPAFPLDRFPQWIQEHIDRYTATNGVSKDYCAACILGTISAVTVGHCDIPFNGHREPIQLYSLFVGSSGTMKSSVIKHFMQPANDWLRINNDKTTKTNYAIKKELEQLEKQLAAEQKAGKKANAQLICDLTAKIDAKRQERHNAFPIPLDDVTPESLVNAMSFSRGTANIATAEGNIINVIVGVSYTNKGTVANIDVFLKGADAEQVHRSRITTGDIDIPRADLSMLLAIQPALLERLCKSADAVGRGLAQRFLIYAPPEDQKSTIDHTKTVYFQPVYNEVWTQHIKTIAARFMDPDADTKTMELEPAADMVIRRFWNETSEMINERSTADEDSIIGWLAKCHGKALRLSALLALLRDKDAMIITEADAENAVALFKEYYIPQFVGAYERADNLTREQRQLVNWIIRHAKATDDNIFFTERELWIDARQRVAFAGKTTGPAHFKAALDDLKAKNYIRPATPTKTVSGRGRPSKTWQVNPEIYTK